MRLLLLLYVPRSGSTFFASLVAKNFERILVLPELRLPKLLASHDIAKSENPKQTLLQLVNRDHQFAALDMSMEEVEACIDRMPGNTAEDFLLEIARALAHRKNLNPKAVLYKCGSAGRQWPELRKQMPNTSFIHIYRDARAAVNSAMQTERPYHPGQKMGRGDPWGSARYWSDFVARMGELREAGEPVYEIRYEDLCESPQRLLQEFADICGVSRSAGGGAEFAVSAREEDIHVNVDKNAMPERIEAWKKEMPRWQGLLIEWLAGDELRRRGYVLFYADCMSLPHKLPRLAYGYCYHLVATLYFHVRRRLVRARS